MVFDIPMILVIIAGIVVVANLAIMLGLVRVLADIREARKNMQKALDAMEKR